MVLINITLNKLNIYEVIDIFIYPYKSYKGIYEYFELIVGVGCFNACVDLQLAYCNDVLFQVSGRFTAWATVRCAFDTLSRLDEAIRELCDY